MSEREKMRVHTLSADHEVVCTCWCNNSVHTGVNQNVVLYVPVGSEI